MVDIGEATELAEQVRIYHFPQGEQVRLEKVTELVVRPSGTHRLKTNDGKLHIIPTGWLHIEIETQIGDWTI